MRISSHSPNSHPAVRKSLGTPVPASTPKAEVDKVALSSAATQPTVGRRQPVTGAEKTFRSLGRNIGVTHQEARLLLKSPKADPELKKLAMVALSEPERSTPAKRPARHAGQVQSRIVQRAKARMKKLLTDARSKMLKVLTSINKLREAVTGKKRERLDKMFGLATLVNRGLDVIASGDMKSGLKIIKDALKADKLKPLFEGMSKSRLARAGGKAIVPVLGTGLYFWDARSASKKAGKAEKAGDSVAAEWFRLASGLNTVAGILNALSDVCVLISGGSALPAVAALEVGAGGLAALAEITAHLQTLD